MRSSQLLSPCVLMLAAWCVCSLRMCTVLKADDSGTAAVFDSQVAPVLARHCLSCHNSSDRSGGLDLSRSEGLSKGGEGGPVVVENDPNRSPLVMRIRSGEMPPPDSKPATMSEAEVQILADWIAAGSRFGTSPVDRYMFSTESRAGADWWSLQPVVRPDAPKVQEADWCSGTLDYFVMEKLEAAKLKPAPRADRRTLIRRLYLDLIGLPPEPRDVEEFVKSTDPNAWEALIDHLLASPHYGERWGRHWLDVARFTESQGFEYDRFRPNAWHYRDYVIQSLNSDKRYDIFLQEQIAGDARNFAQPDAPVQSEGVIASSLLVCGPWDQAGNAQANLTQRKTTREEELEELVSVIGQTFLGITVNCGRCHSHKFDPVTQEDYYRFRAVFDGVRHGERSIETESQAVERQKQLSDTRRAAEATEHKIRKLENQVRQQMLAAMVPDDAVSAETRSVCVPPVARWTFEADTEDLVGDLDGTLKGGAAIRNGRLILNGQGQYLQTSALKQKLQEKTLEAWVYLSTLQQGGGGILTVESGGGANFDSIVYGEREPGKWIAGSAGFGRTRDLLAGVEDQAASQPVHVVVVYQSDNTIAVYRNGRTYGEPYVQGTLQTFAADDSRVLIGLRHTGAGNGFLNGEVESASLYDRALLPEEISASFSAGVNGGAIITDEQLLAAMTDQQKNERETLLKDLAGLRERMKHQSRPRMSYAGLREQPEPAFRLERGSVTSPAEQVTPAALSVIRTPSGEFGLAADAPEAERRIRMAQWMADPGNPLPARVLVNRIWHYRFGRGIVETPNDFGFNGSRPTHPQLLDWLAAEFVGGQRPWSIKHLHKLILMSSTFQQSSVFNAAAAEVDAENSLLWRFAPRRLEGEVIRDAMLAVSGQLNRRAGGPSFQPWTVTNHGSDFYHLADSLGAEFNRRTIYRAHVSSGKSPMMDALDCPDPSIKTPARRVTTTPLAALALMNNSFVQRQAEFLADRVRSEATDLTADQVRQAYLICFGRDSSEEETIRATALAEQHGLPTLCWVLLNATEFVYLN